MLVQPNQRRPTFSERGIVARPVRRAVTARARLSHAIRLMDLVRDTNNLPSEFCDNVQYGTLIILLFKQIDTLFCLGLSI